MMTVAPCKGCCKRNAKCHSECPDYIAFLKKHEKELEMKKKYNAEKDYNAKASNKSATLKNRFQKAGGYYDR